jgi:cobalt-zinc-cadmium resistance protein CzcA
MLGRTVAFALAQRGFVLLCALVLVAAGVRAYRNTPIDAFPDVSSTQVKVIVKAPGMTPEEVEARITAPIEVEVLGIPNQVMLRSTTKYALADITVDFREGTDVYWARQQVAERLAGIWGELPPGIAGGLAPITTPLGEMFMFTVEGEGHSLTERRALLDWVLRPALRSVPGVADVNALGGEVRSFEVAPDPARLLARGVSQQELAAALEGDNRDVGAGRLSDGEETLLVRVQGSVRDLHDIRAIVVRGDLREPVRVGDVADVRIGALTRYGAVTRDGRGEAVQGLVLGLRGANARAVVEGVRAKLAELAPTLPEGIAIRPFYDRGDLVERAVGTVRRALIEAVVLVGLVLVVFLGELRAALAAALVVPLAVCATFLAMSAAGMSANLMSLGGLAIAIGLLVDGAVVVVENVVTQLQQPEAARLPRAHVVYRAVREVAAPVTAGTTIILIVFLPLLTLEGLEGKLFAPVALTIVFALAGSLALSLTAIPVLASWLLGGGAHRERRFLHALDAWYARTLHRALAHERVVLGAAVLLALVAAGLYTRIGKTFLPTLDEGALIVQLEKLPSIALEPSIALDLRIQRAILDAVPDVSGAVARVGSDEIGLDPMGLNQTDTFLELRPRDEWQARSKEEIVDQLRSVLERFPGVAFGFTQPIEMRVSEMLTGVRGDLAIKVFGPDLEGLAETASRIAAVLERVPGAADVFASQTSGAQYLEVQVDRVAAGRLGVRADAIGAQLRAQIEGERVGTVYEGSRRTPLLLRGGAALRESPGALGELRLGLAEGLDAPLAGLARIERVEGPVAIPREQGMRMAAVLVNVDGRDLVGFVEEAKQRVAAEVPLPAGFRLEWGGQFQNQQRAAARLALVLPVALGLILLLLFSTFRSLPQAVLVLVNVPLALIGGVFGLAVTGSYLSVPASIGFIALLGIAVLNGVVLVSHYNQLRATGMPVGRVVVEGSRRRLRPVLMTALATALGLVPLLFATGPGSELQRPLAIVVVGGLASSTALTLLLLPMLYRRFGDRRGARGGSR